MVPDNYIFIYSYKNMPLFWCSPSSYDVIHTKKQITKLIRTYFKIIRVRKPLYTSLIPGDCGAITCGELAIYILRRQQSERNKSK